MKEEHQLIIKSLEQALIKLDKKCEAANHDDMVSFSNYRSVVLALRRCQLILEDFLHYLPFYKQADARLYLSILGDVNADVATYSGVNYLSEFVLPAEPPYRQQYTDIKDPKFSPRDHLEKRGLFAPAPKKKAHRARPVKGEK